MRAENSQRLTQNVGGGGGSQRLGSRLLSLSLYHNPALPWKVDAARGGGREMVLR